MGFLDKAKDKLGDAVDEHGDKIADGIDKAADFVDDKTGGKHGDKIDTGADKAKDALDSLDGKNDDISVTQRSTTAASSSSRRRTSSCCARARAGTEVLLQLRQNTGYMDDHWAAAAAGHVERGETAYDAARREALEELGVTD